MACDSPFYVMPKAGTEKVPVPCGKCPPCKMRRVNSWVYRLQKESEKHPTSHFITLTYDTDHVPISSNGFLTLRPSDLTKYWKRLRKNTRANIRYYAVGEYGTNNGRPHYHAIVFGISDAEDFNTAWGLGSVYVGNVTSDSIAYTCKYINKPISKPKHGRDDRIREFSRMSKGLGDNYINQAAIDYHEADLSRLYLTKPGGYRIAMPRYYRQKIYSEKTQKVQIGIIKLRMEKEEQRMRDAWLTENSGGDYDRYLEQGKYARHKKFYSQLKLRDL